MSVSPLLELLQDWETGQVSRRHRLSHVVDLHLHATDLIKLRALGSLYQLDESDIISSLLHVALLELEGSLPGDAPLGATALDPVLSGHLGGPVTMPRYLDKIREIARGG